MLAPLRADVPLPAERDARLDRDARRHRRRQHLVAVLVWLLVEELPARKRDDARVQVERPCALERDGYLGARREHDRVGLGARIALPQHVPAAQWALARIGHALAAEHRQLLPGEGEPHRPAVALERDLPGGDGLVRVPRAHHPEVRHRAQRHQVLDGLVRGAVLPEPDRVVRPDPDHGQVRERRQPDRGSHVVGEHEEGRPVGLEDPRLEDDPVHDRPHPVLADPERDVAADVGRREDPAALELGLRGLDQVCGAADQGRREVLERLHHRLPGVARRDLLAGLERRQRLLPAVARAPLQVELAVCRRVRMRVGPCLEPLLPRRAGCRATLAHTLHMVANRVGDDERLVRIPAEHLLRPPHLVLTERRPVGLRRVDRVGRRVGDVRAENDERRPAVLGARRRERGAQRIQVVRVVDVLDVPPVRFEALPLVLADEADRRRAVDGDVVVVVDVHEASEPELARDRRRLLRHPLHHVAVGADRVHPRVDERVVRPVPPVGEEALCDREPHAVRKALAQRARRRLDPRRVPELRVSRGPRAPLPKMLQVVHRHVVARQVERDVLEDAGMPRGEDEAVAARPIRRRGIVAHLLRVEEVGDGGERHRRARMARVRLLDGVHREDADRVDRETSRVGRRSCGQDYAPRAVSGDNRVGRPQVPVEEPGRVVERRPPSGSAPPARRPRRPTRRGRRRPRDARPRRDGSRSDVLRSATRGGRIPRPVPRRRAPGACGRRAA